MKITRNKLVKLIKEELERLSFASKDHGYTYGIEHISNKTSAHDDIIGHT